MLKSILILISFFSIILLTNTASWRCSAEAQKSSDENNAGEPDKHDISLDKEVLSLDNNNMEETINAHKNVLVAFVHPRCPHCTALIPEFKEAAKILKTKAESLVLGLVDCEKNEVLRNDYNITAYPTIKFFKNTKAKAYGGGRRSNDIVSWVELEIAHPVLEVDDIEADMKKLLLVVAFVGRFKSKESKGYEVFFDAAGDTRHDVKAYAVFNEEGPEEISIKLLDGEDIKYDGKLEKEELVKFVKNEAFPLLGAINAKNFHQYFERGLEMVWLCGTEADINERRKSIQEAAKEHRQQYSYVFLDSEAYPEHCTTVLGVSEFPALVIQAKSGRYILQDASKALFDKSKIIQFFDDVKAGKVEKSVKSEKIPEATDGPVVIVVGKTFNELVFRPSTDVLLMIYAPWCGHCKKLEPTFDKLAEKLKPYQDKVVIAKMDGTANEATSENFSWTGFPTIFFVKAGETIPMQYEGSRELSDFIQYLEKHSTRGLKVGESSSVSSDKSEEL